MKAFFRKLAHLKKVKKRQVLKRAIAGYLFAVSVRYGSGRLNQTTDLSQEKQPITTLNNQTQITDTGLTCSQEELDALGLGKVNKEVTLVVGISQPPSSQNTLAVHGENWNKLIQESNVPMNVETQPKIRMNNITKSDLKNSKWVKDWIVSLRGGDVTEEDEKLIESILSKVAESDLDIQSVNKKIVDAALSVAFNEKLLKILVKLENPVQPSVSTVHQRRSLVFRTNYKIISMNQEVLYFQVQMGMFFRKEHFRKKHIVSTTKIDHCLVNQRRKFPIIMRKEHPELLHRFHQTIRVVNVVYHYIFSQNIKKQMYI